MTAARNATSRDSILPQDDGSAPPYLRPEFENTAIGAAQNVDVERDLSLFERISNINAVRKLSILVGLIVVWQLYTVLGNIEPLLFPTFTATAEALYGSVMNGEMVQRIWLSVEMLLIGYAAGLALAALLLAFAVLTRINSTQVNSDILGTLTHNPDRKLDSMFARINEEGRGAILFINQEMQPLELLNRIAELRGMQETGNLRAPEIKMDVKDFGIGAQILHDIDICNVALFWHFVAATVLVTVAVVALFPEVA